jgi:hypothetical protein
MMPCSLVKDAAAHVFTDSVTASRKGWCLSSRLPDIRPHLKHLNVCDTSHDERQITVHFCTYSRQLGDISEYSIATIHVIGDFDRLLASTTEIGQKQVAEFVYVCTEFYGQLQ